jgi:hypothetical protein
MPVSAGVFEKRQPSVRDLDGVAFAGMIGGWAQLPLKMNKIMAVGTDLTFV